MAGKRNSGKTFPIVGIGASAGGLNALECFVGQLPREFGFAVVFMQHLSTKHKSLLPGLLHNRRPDMRIVEIAEGVELLPGNVFLCPPGEEVTLRQGSFHVTPPAEDHVHFPVDEFLVSIAEEAGERAIAVILSGAGTDGARGAQSVRKAGGTVFVQDPDTAEFPSMPVAAIGTGQADAVLPPEEIAREILKLHDVLPSGPSRDITPQKYEAFSRLIREKTGYNFTHFKRSVVGRRIMRRMFLRGLSSFREYLTIVAEQDLEAANLASDLMIGVTSFFRDRLAWKALKTGVIRRLAASDDDQSVRIWCPACATGEEAYSVAIMLRHELDLGGKRREIQVFATDINEAALEKAREGRYPCSIAADAPSEYMKKFFTWSEDGISVIISKELRESVVFARHDLLADPPFSRLDLIICRNLLIYLEADAQERCIALFHYALKDGGYLFLGNAETPGRKSPLFRSLPHKKCRIYKKVETEHQRPFPSVPFTSERPIAAPLRAAAEPAQSINEFIQQALLEESGPAAVAVNQHYDIIFNNGPTNRYLRQPRGAPTQNLLELLPKNLSSRIRGALHRINEEARPIILRALLPYDSGKTSQVSLRIARLKENLFLIIFRERRGAPEEEEVAFPESAVDESAVRQLESELSATRAELQSNIEQLKSLNEELQSSNEELQAANEELETSREELQSLNEELITVNAQLQSKVEEQEETNNDLNNFLSSTNIPTFFLDHQFRVKRFTPAMSRLLKLIPADVGRPIIDMSQDNLGPDLIPDAQSVLNNLVPVKKEIAIDGAWYIRSALPYRTSDNRIEGVVITYNDVSEIKKAEEITGRLAAIVESADDAIISKDLNGVVTTWNVGAEKIFGYTAEEAIGRHISFLQPVGHNDDSSAILEKIVRGEHIEHFETEHMRKDGTIIPVSLIFSAIRDENGRVVGASKIAHDVTARKKAEEALRESEERFRIVQELSPDGFSILRPARAGDEHVTDFTWVYANNTTQRFVGKKLEELVGRSLLKLFPGHRDSPLLEAYRQVAETGEARVAETPYQGDNVLADRWFRVAVVPLGKDIAVLSQDITGRKRAEEEIRRRIEELRLANEELNRFNQAAVGRELRMIELKEEINELCTKAGLPVRYPLDFEKEG